MLLRSQGIAAPLSPSKELFEPISLFLHHPGFLKMVTLRRDKPGRVKFAILGLLCKFIPMSIDLEPGIVGRAKAMFKIIKYCLCVPRD